MPCSQEYRGRWNAGSRLRTLAAARPAAGQRPPRDRARARSPSLSCSLGAGLDLAVVAAAPAVVFIALAIVHGRVDPRSLRSRPRRRLLRTALARLGNHWIGKGNQGERFRDPKHVYADDLDLFGRGSLFELLSTARTAAGEGCSPNGCWRPGNADACRRARARWRNSAPASTCASRLALMGEDIRAAVDAKLGTGAISPPPLLSRRARGGARAGRGGGDRRDPLSCRSYQPAPFLA